METSKAAERSVRFRNLPSVDELIRSETAARLMPDAGSARLTEIARAVAEGLRQAIANGDVADADLQAEFLLAEAESRLVAAWASIVRSRLTRVINATGVVIHTNLGRAPLSEAARSAIAEEAAGYASVEYDLETGKRGKRGRRVEELLCELTGAESALVVNNCAAAAFLVLTVFAAGGEVVISRGELVEIGGDFRVPDVLERSGAKLAEVGTTNRTKLADYENAINDSTKMILRVHPSNYRIVGFTASPGIAELASLAHSRGILLFEDAGSGALVNLSNYGLRDEPVIADSIAAGADIVTFSGDKLLGGPQAGLLVGKLEVVEKIRKHPLYRALRADKLAYGALGATLESYRSGNFANEIPVIRMLSLTKSDLSARAANFAERLRRSVGDAALDIEMINGSSAVGGGSAPNVELETVLVLMGIRGCSSNEFEAKLRLGPKPVITRIVDDCVAIDLRTVFENEEDELIDAIAAAVR